ncbi:MAG: hypothetical protein GY832_24280 [Chloroflexi bacterium]|nr:hypothetical protein [Chloroflexota bacterium]
MTGAYLYEDLSDYYCGPSIYGTPYRWKPTDDPNHPLNVAARERSRAYDKACNLERKKAGGRE